MAKFYGEIGFGETVKVEPGIWEEQITKRFYCGDSLKINSRTQPSENLNDNILIHNVISILSDPYADENFYNIKYVKFMGAKWKITNVEIQYPRLILTIGGIYNDDE